MKFTTCQVVFVLFVYICIPMPNVLAAPDPNKAPQQPILKKSGAIKGTVNFCGNQGNDGTVLSLLGHSFSVQTDASGVFTFNYVPANSYNLKVEVPGEVPVIVNVDVEKKKVTDLGTINICPDNDSDGFPVDVDCNDNNPTVHPGASETCDGFDNNCDGQVDEGCTTCTDGDSDGFFAQANCGTVEDCNDADNTVFPGAMEVCDGVDNDCNAIVDEGFDGDSDGFTSCSGDCNDGNPNVNPSATEVCDGVDNNCDGSIDEGDVCPMCPAGEMECSGMCIDVTSDPNNCGGCGISCGPHSTCAGGGCICDAGFFDCNLNSADGCESQTPCP